MKRAIRNGLLGFIILFAIACSSSKPQFGKMSIQASPSDSSTAKKLIARIKSFDASLFETGSFVGREKITVPFRLFRPKTIPTDTSKYPLIVVFHGSDAIGTNNEAQLGLLPKLFASQKIQRKHPAFVFAPQFSRRSSNYMMNSSRNELVAVPQPLLGDVIEYISSLKRTLPIDPDRIYVIGYSMGGSSAINAIAKRPDLFAACISIAGVPQFESIRILAKKPIWLIHGNQDQENPYSGSNQLFKELSFAKKVRFWEFEGKAHQNIFNRDLLGEELPNWLFAHKNSKEFHLNR